VRRPGRSARAGLVLEEQEAGGLEDRAVAQPAEPFDAALVRHPGHDDAVIGERLQSVRLGVRERAAEPREVVGEAARAVGPAALPWVVAVRRSGTPVGLTRATESAPSQLGVT
jgi:hypothetical protein